MYSIIYYNNNNAIKIEVLFNNVITNIIIII